MRAAVYLRVSSTDGRQDEANQEPDCARLCAARGWEPVWYRERESAVKDRPMWRAVVEAARRGEVQAVVFWALDRIGRRRVQVAHDVGELTRFKVAVVSVQDAWLDQPDGPLRDLLVQFMGWVAEGERSKLIERTRAGQARARAEGRHPGRPPVPPERVARILEYASAHPLAGQRAMARALEIPRSTVRDVLAGWTKNGAQNAPGQPTVIRGL